MGLPTTEMRRAKGRYGLLSAAVGLLVFLILFQQALLGGLVTAFIGALRNQSADVLVIGADAQKNLEGSRVDPSAVAKVAAVDGVLDSGPLGEGTFTADVDGRLVDMVLFGYRLGGPGRPTKVVQGRLPRADFEAVASPTDKAPGIARGRQISIVPGGRPITIVGISADSQYSATPTLFVSFPTYEAARRAVNPDATAIAPSAVAVAVQPGTESAVARRITTTVSGVEALTRQTAVDESPGVSSVRQSLSLVLALFYLVVPLVAGLFFLITTLQKANSLTLLRALGAPPSLLVRSLLVQVTLVVLAGVTLATLLLIAAVQGIDFVTVDGTSILMTAGVVLLLALLASLAAIRRVLRIDPVAATTGTGVLG